MYWLIFEKGEINQLRILFFWVKNYKRPMVSSEVVVFFYLTTIAQEFEFNSTCQRLNFVIIFICLLFAKVSRLLIERFENRNCLILAEV